MKKILIIACWIGACLNGLAQSLIVKNVEELANDISARTLSRVDKDNNPCALVRINLPTLDRLQFEGAVVGDVKQLPGEYIVYLEAGTASLSYTCNRKKTGINFADYDIAVEGKKSYRITLEEEGRKHDAQSTRAYISANYDNVIVMIDGIPMGQLPVSIESIEEGRHTIAVPNTSGITMKDTVVVIAKGKENKIYLSLHEEEPKPSTIELVGMGLDGDEPRPFWGVHKIKKNGKEGLTSYTGEVIVPCEFDYVSFPENDGNCIVYQNLDTVDSWGRSELDRLPSLYKKGKGRVTPWGDYHFSCQYSDGMITLRPRHTKSGDGLFNDEGKMILPCRYNTKTGDLKWKNGVISAIENVKENGKTVKYGMLYDYEGNKLIEPIKNVKWFGTYNEGYCLFEEGWPTKRGIVDLNGNKKYLPEGYDFDNHVNDRIVSFGLFKVIGREGYGYMDTDMNLVIPAIFNDDTCYGYDGIFVLKSSSDGHRVVIDNKGQVIFEDSTKQIEPARIYHYKNGEFVINVTNNDGKAGIYDSSGRVIIPCQKYNRITIYEENNDTYYLCRLEKEQYELLDTKLNLVSKFTLPDEDDEVRIQWLENGFIQIMNKESQLGYINIHGEILVNCIYGVENDEGDGYNSPFPYTTDENESKSYYNLAYLMYDWLCDYGISEGLAIVNLGDRFGYMDNTGKFVVPMIYTGITPFVNGVAYARDQEGKWKEIYRKDL